MVSRTDTTLDLHLLERIGLLVVLGGLLLCATSLEADRRLEHDVLTESGGICLRARGPASLAAHLGPCAALSYARVLLLLDDGAADALGALYFFAVLVDENGDDGLGAVLVLRDLGRGNGGSEVGLAIFGPVDGFLCLCCHLCGCAICVRPFAVRVLACWLVKKRPQMPAPLCQDSAFCATCYEWEATSHHM